MDETQLEMLSLHTTFLQLAEELYDDHGTPRLDRRVISSSHENQNVLFPMDLPRAPVETLFETCMIGVDEEKKVLDFMQTQNIHAVSRFELGNSAVTFLGWQDRGREEKRREE